MKLIIGERAALLGILPREGNIDTLKALRKFKESLSLSEEEKQGISWKLEYKCPGCNQAMFLPATVKCGSCDVWLETTGRAQWDLSLDPNKDVFVTSTVSNIIFESLTKLDKASRLTEELVPLYEKFVSEEN